MRPSRLGSPSSRDAKRSARGERRGMGSARHGHRWRGLGTSRLASLTLAAAACARPAEVPKASIGAVLERDDASGAVIVRAVPRGRAAARAGLSTGDRLVMIDGHHVDALGSAEVIARLRGPAGSRVELTVVRGETVRDVEVVREPLGDRVEAVPDRERPE